MNWISLLSKKNLTVTREGDCVRIEYKEEGIPVTHLQIGPKIATMSDREVIELITHV